MSEANFIIFIAAVILSYVYAFVGGFTDSANAIATSVGSRVLSPLQAVGLASIFELIGALTGTAVALTIGKGIVHPESISLLTVPAAVMGCMTWSLFTYYFGIPVSETHGLIGGVVGAAIATAGVGVIMWTGLTKILVAMIFSPVLGFIAGWLVMVLVVRLSRGGTRAFLTPLFTNLQRLSAMFMAFSHGRNDAQKPMGILAMTLAIYYGWSEVHVPLWVIFSCAALASLGMFSGGWRIIRTLGLKLTRLRPVEGFSAETSAAAALQLASVLGIPVSTTHTITSSIVGVGSSRGLSRVRWGIAREIVASWVLTLPATIILGGLYLIVLRAIFT